MNSAARRGFVVSKSRVGTATGNAGVRPTLAQRETFMLTAEQIADEIIAARKPRAGMRKRRRSQMAVLQPVRSDQAVLAAELPEVHAGMIATDGDERTRTHARIFFVDKAWET